MGENVKKPITYDRDYEERVQRVLSSFKHKDLQKFCIVRGLEFIKVVTWGHQSLISWVYQNFDNAENPQLLVEYDSWQEEELQKRGYKKGDAMLSPSLRMGYVEPIEKLDRPREIKPESKSSKDGPKEPRVKKDTKKIDEKTGLRAGTKKALTYQLAQTGKGFEEVVSEVQKEFPGADDKSIKIWYKRAIKAMGDAK